MKTKFFSALITLLLLVVSVTNAQNAITVTGKVTDSMGELPGVNIVVKGTTVGTTSGIDGTFVLKNLKSSDILVFTSVGYKNLEMKVGNRTSFDVEMREDSKALDEVVVVAVGYGDVRRRDLTGSVSKANMDDLIKTPTTNVAETLGGRVAGVQVSSADGGLGDNFQITIRGAGSLTQSTAPLYVVDGFPQEESGLNAVNPNDIESIDILKDASATAIYGARGANGVVIITTKKGTSGKPTVSYSGSLTVSTVKNLPDLMNGYDFVLLQKDVMSDTDFAEYYLKDDITLEDYKHFKSYDWQDMIFRTAVSHNHHINMNGQSGKTRYSTSLSYSRKEGVIINSDLNTYQGRIKLHQALADNLKVDANVNFSSKVQNGPTPSDDTFAASNAWMYSVWAYRPVSPSGNDLLGQMYDEEVMDANDYRFNPVLSAQNEYRKKKTNNLQANASIEWEIIKNLKFKTMAGYTSMDYTSEEFNGPQTKTGNSHPNNTQSRGINAKLYENTRHSYLNENTLSYVRNKNKHNFNALLGFSVQVTDTYSHSIATDHITNESFGMAGLDKGAVPVVTTHKGENKMMSYFGRVNYNYASKYYLNFTMRADGSSKFSEDNRWGYFPSGSIAWNFSREKFVKNALPWLNNGKLRASYGFTGNNRIGDYDYMAHLEMSEMGTGNDISFYPFGSSKETGYLLKALANKSLKWETTEQLDLGLDLGFLDGRINATLDYYIKTTKDLLLNSEISASSGYMSGMMNVGKIRNKGFEFTLETVNIKNKNFTWTSNFNIAFNKNEIIALNSGQTEMQSFIRWDNHFNNMPAYISKVGESAGKMYGFVYEGTYKVDEFNATTNADGSTKYVLKEGIPYYSNICQPGDPKYKDLSGDGVINDADRKVIGRGHPLHTGGFTNNLTYKNWDLNIFFQWSYGNDIWNINRLRFENTAGRRNTNQFSSFNNRWSFDNQMSNMPRAYAVGSDVYSSLYVEDGSYLKLKNVSLGYTLPKSVLSKIKISNARFYLSADNIFTITDYSGMDPEVSTRHSVLTPGFDWSSYPRSFNASFGVNITF